MENKTGGNLCTGLYKLCYPTIQDRSTWSKFGAHGEHGDVFVFSNTLIYGISRDGSKTFNIRTCEHMIPGQLRMGARQAKNAPLIIITITHHHL